MIGRTTGFPPADADATRASNARRQYDARNSPQISIVDRQHGFISLKGLDILDREGVECADFED